MPGEIARKWAEARASGATRDERLEETREHLWGDPSAGITDAQEQMRALRVCGYAHHPAAWGVL